MLRHRVRDRDLIIIGLHQLVAEAVDRRNIRLLEQRELVEHIRRLLLGGERFFEPRLHFGRRILGKSHGQYGSDGNSILYDQSCQAFNQHRRFSRTGAGRYHDIFAARFDRLQLLL